MMDEAFVRIGMICECVCLLVKSDISPISTVSTLLVTTNDTCTLFFLTSVKKYSLFFFPFCVEVWICHVPGKVVVGKCDEDDIFFY